MGDVPGYVFSAGVRFRRPAVYAPVCLLPDVPCTAIARNRSLLRGAQMHTFVTRFSGPIVIDVMGASRRDLEEIEAPASDVLRSLRIG